MKKIIATGLYTLAFCSSGYSNSTMIDGKDFGPLALLVGSWESTDTGGVDLAPSQAKEGVAPGQPAVSPFYEKFTFEVAADATNASKQHLVALYYKQEVFRKSDNTKFHDQRGYFIYDKERETVYNSFCIPRATCVTAEGKAGLNMTLKSSDKGIAESNFMNKNAKTNSFVMNIKIEKNKLSYTQTTDLAIYGKSFSHTDGGNLVKVGS
ncbi:heme-binding beta-barrel domain-containing protein [Candidatus Sororendozoicomonas aggregata]|uniref:heme-binding beta-barrel domain-containing protein n=1 Tax=Candidatus Sororendozoicomonas aggregata TaxID=3073239 RepID=UPI002ED18D65